MKLNKLSLLVLVVASTYARIGFCMVQPVQPFTSTQEFSTVKDELGEMFGQYVIPLPAESAGEKYQGLAQAVTWRLERDLLPKWTPSVDVVLNNLHFIHARHLDTGVVINGEKRFIDNDSAMLPLQMGQQKFIIAAHAHGTVLITTNPFAAKTQDTKETTRAVLDWMKQYFVRVPGEADVKVIPLGANLRVISEEPEVSFFVTPHYLAFVMPLLIGKALRPASTPSSDDWIDRTNERIAKAERSILPSDTKPAFPYERDDNDKPNDVVTLFQELAPPDRVFVVPPTPDATLAKEKVAGISNAFWYRLKDVLQTKYIPPPAFIGEHGIFARNVEIGEAQKADMVHLPVRFWSLDKEIEQYITREFRIAQSGNKIVVSIALPHAIDLTEQAAASQALIAFMSQWTTWTPEPKDLVFDKIENGYTARLARRARETAPFGAFHAVVTPHIISISLRKPSPDYSAARGATLNQWFDLEK